MTTQLDTTRTYTVKEFLELPEPGDGTRFELIKGELIEMPGPNLTHGRITARLVIAIGKYLDQAALEGGTQPLGEVLTNMAFAMADKSVVLPDVAFVTTSKLAGANREDAFNGAPDLAIEVMSPSDKWSEVIEKVREYQAFQTSLVWVIDPFDRAVNVFLLGQPRQLILATGELSGESVLPGFKLPVQVLFD